MQQYIRTSRFRLVACLLLTLIVVVATSPANAGLTAFVTGAGAAPGDSIMCGKEITFNIRLDNDAGSILNGMGQTFEIYTLNGSPWQPVTWDTAGGLDVYFDLVLNAGGQGITGTGADTVFHQAVILSGPGLPADYDDVVLTISTTVDCAYTGDELCIDSCWHPSGPWDWVLEDQTHVVPTWGGPYCFTIVPNTVPDFFTIPQVYDGIDSLEGQTVKVFGEYIAGDDSKLVTLYADYLRDEPMPENSLMLLAGLLPDTAYWLGGLMVVEGVITTEPKEPDYSDDTLLTTLTAASYEYILPGYGTLVSPLIKQNDLDGSIDIREDDDRACDPCKFAIIVAGDGGPDHKPTYWENAANLRKHKIDNEDYCPSTDNIYVFFKDGTSEDTSEIPHDEVHPCTESAINQGFDEISQRIAQCNGRATVQKMFTNHGANDAGVCLADRQYLNPTELTGLQQQLIDSCCRQMYDEFITCYGGDMTDGLLNLDNMNKTQIHVNTAAGQDFPGYSPYSGGHVYLNAKIECLQSSADYDYEYCVSQAKLAYIDYLWALTTDWIAQKESLATVWNALPPGPRRDAVDNQFDSLHARLTTLNGAIHESGQSWMRHSFSEFCQEKRFSALSGQELSLHFTGVENGGHVDVWFKDTATGTWYQHRVWYWNILHSPGYTEGNNIRRVRMMEGSSPIATIHAADGPFTVTAHSRPDTTRFDSPSNREDGAGFSCGWRDTSSAEFENIIAGMHESVGTDEDGFYLSNVPGRLGGAGGTLVYTAHYTALADNAWWHDMEVWVNVHSVSMPGTLTISCPQADNTSVDVDIVDPGEYAVPLGSVLAPGAGTITFDASVSGLVMEWDCWAMRSLVPTWDDDCCILRGDVDMSGSGPDIADLVYLVTYMFQNGPPPPCSDSGYYAEADINGDLTGPDIADLVYLVTYMFQNGPAPVPCP